MEEKNINKKDMTEFEKALQEILKQDINISTDMSDVENYDNSFDKINEELLKYYQKHTGNDFEEEYRNELMLAVKEKFEKDINDGNKSKDKDEITEEEEYIRNLSDEALDDEEVDEDVKEEVVKEAEKENNDKKLSAEEIKAIVRKEVYKKVYEQYAHDVLQYKKLQASKENITTFALDSKGAIKNIYTEKYLGNLERSYKNVDGNNSLEADPEIKKMKDEFAYQVKDYDKSIDRSVDENLVTINTLIERRNEISKEMSEISENDLDFKEKMEALQKEYMTITFKINSLKPSIADYEKQLNEASSIERVAFKNGLKPEKGEVVAGEYIDRTNQKTINDTESGNIKNLNEIEDEQQKELLKSVEENINRIDELMKNYDENVEEIEQLLQAVEMQLGIEVEKNNYAENDKSSKMSNEELDRREKNRTLPVNSEESFMSEYNSQIATDDEAVRHGIKRENIEQRIESVRKGYMEMNKTYEEVQNKGYVLERTRNTKK